MFGMGIPELLILGSIGMVGLVSVAVIFFLIRAIQVPQIAIPATMISFQWARPQVIN